MSGSGATGDRHARIERLVREVEALGDPAARGLARALVQEVLDLHGVGLGRMLDLAAGGGEPGRALVEAFTRDPAVASLLLLHGLHPVDLETRVRAALEGLAPRLRPHGARVDLLAAAADGVRVRLLREGAGCGSAATSLRGVVEGALLEAAPDAAAIEVEEVAVRPEAGFVPAERLGVREPGRRA